MGIAEFELAELKRAYKVLGVPLAASALAIKQAYRRIVKRWHPDRYTVGTPSHDEATQMMKLINDAYSRVQHAPLRYHIETYPRVAQQRNRSVPDERGGLRKPSPDVLPVTDRLELWVRFVCGALLGVVLSVELILSFFDVPGIGVITGILVLACGLAATKYGDGF